MFSLFKDKKIEKIAVAIDKEFESILKLAVKYKHNIKLSDPEVSGSIPLPATKLRIYFSDNPCIWDNFLVIYFVFEIKFLKFK